MDQGSLGLKLDEQKGPTVISGSPVPVGEGRSCSHEANPRLASQDACLPGSLGPLGPVGVEMASVPSQDTLGG